MTLSYDKRADVLYVTFEVATPESYAYVENESGIVLKVDRSSKRIVGCTIPFFASRAASGKIVIPEIGGTQLTEIMKGMLHA